MKTNKAKKQLRQLSKRRIFPVNDAISATEIRDLIAKGLAVIIYGLVIITDTGKEETARAYRKIKRWRKKPKDGKKD